MSSARKPESRRPPTANAHPISVSYKSAHYTRSVGWIPASAGIAEVRRHRLLARILLIFVGDGLCGGRVLTGRFSFSCHPRASGDPGDGRVQSRTGRFLRDTQRTSARRWTGLDPACAGMTEDWRA
jgi:hypothetical protein